MDFVDDVSDFTGMCRLFPLPDLVFFPHSLLPLHIFEPRYRQMTADALADDRLVAMVQIRPAAPGAPLVEPVPIVEIGCLGRIVRHERLPDGRYNFLLHGCKRLRLIREVPNQKLYRIAEAAILDDVVSAEPAEPRRGELIDLFQKVVARRHGLDKDLQTLFDSAAPLGVVTDIIAHSLPLPAAVKQLLLDEPAVDSRVAALREILAQIVARDQQAQAFPPRFSAN